MPKTLTPNLNGSKDIVVPVNGDDVIGETTEAPLQALLNRIADAESKLATLKSQNANEVVMYAGTVRELTTPDGFISDFGLSPSDSWSVSRITSNIDSRKKHHRITHNLGISAGDLRKVSILLTELDRTAILNYTVIPSENYFDVIAVSNETDEIITSTQFSFALFIKP